MFNLLHALLPLDDGLCIEDIGPKIISLGRLGRVVLDIPNVLPYYVIAFEFTPFKDRPRPIDELVDRDLAVLHHLKVFFYDFTEFLQALRPTCVKFLGVFS